MSIIRKRLKSQSSRDTIRQLTSHGYQLLKSGKKHQFYKHPKTGHIVTVVRGTKRKSETIRDVTDELPEFTCNSCHTGLRQLRRCGYCGSRDVGRR